MGTDCKSAAFSFGGSNPPAPTKDSSIRTGYWSFCFICLAKGAARVDSNSIDPPNSPAGESPCATATTAASGRNREELLGLRPAGCACRPRHDAAAGSRDPGSFSARLAQSTRAHQTRKIRTCFRLEKGSDFLFSLGTTTKVPVDGAKLRCLVIDRKPITKFGGCDYEIR